MKATYPSAAAALLCCAPIAFAGDINIIINEVDADTPGTDAVEFIELFSPDGAVALDGLVVVRYNGSDDASYGDGIDLDGFSTDADGYFVIGSELVPNVDLVAWATNGIQNGADAVALHFGDGTDFPNDTPVTTVNLIDAIVYDTNDSDDAGLLVLLNPDQPQVNEAGGKLGSADESNQRCPNGAGGARNTDRYTQGLPSPGGSNTCPPPAVTIINEVDADTPGTDAVEFIELFNPDGAVSLDGLVIVRYNGSDDASYGDAIDLDGFSTNTAGYFVIGSKLVPNVDLVAWVTNGLQNGPDAVALHVGDAVDFPEDTPVTTENLIDAIVYDTNDSDDSGLLVLLNPGQPQVNEAGGGSSADDSNQRCPNGSGGERNTETYTQQAPSPGADNTCPPPIGACCDDSTGICVDDVSQIDCEMGGRRYGGDGSTCMDIEPPCEPPAPTGACCNDVSGICLEDVTQADCEGLGGRYGGDDSTCDVIDPPCVAAEPAALLIAEVVDGTLPNGQPKWVDITNCDTVDVDLSIYSIGNFNNGSTMLGGGAATALTGILAPGDTYVYAYSSEDDTTFQDTYGFAPDQFAGGGFVNGDDAIALFLGLAVGDGSNALLVDVCGEIGVDGTDQPWEYLDSYGRRLPGNGPNPVFTLDEWFFAGANALEGADDDEELQNLLDLTFPAVHSCTDTCIGDIDGSGDIGFGDLLAVLADWQLPGGRSDINMDGIVDFEDLLIVLSTWGAC
jgi:hypothetical protein